MKTSLSSLIYRLVLISAVCTKSKLIETVLMKGHTISFHREIRKISFKLFLISPPHPPTPIPDCILNLAQSLSEILKECEIRPYSTKTEIS